MSSSIESYSGNYSWYKARKDAERLRIERQYKEQQEKIKQLTKDVREGKTTGMQNRKIVRLMIIYEGDLRKWPQKQRHVRRD